MNRFMKSTLSLSLLLAACTPVVSSSLDPISTLRSPTPPGQSFPTASTNTSWQPGTRIIIHSASLSITVDDPLQVLTELEMAVEEAGGYVVSASSWSSPESPAYSSLSARVPPESLPELRRAALEIAGVVQNDSLYTQDATTEYRLLRNRLANLARAQEELWQLVIEADDPQHAATFVILHDLLQAETSSMESQVLSYEDRAQLASFDITLNQPSYYLTPVE